MIKNKFKKIFIIFLFTLTACSYEPIFSKKDYGFEININSITGDKDINRIIKNRLYLITNQGNNVNAINKFNLSIDTKKVRKIISKDSQGDPSRFELTLYSSFEISKSGKILLERKIEKNYIYNNESDKFKLEQSEKIIVENLSEKISEVIISLIMNINDN